MARRTLLDEMKDPNYIGQVRLNENGDQVPSAGTMAGSSRNFIGLGLIGILAWFFLD